MDEFALDGIESDIELQGAVARITLTDPASEQLRLRVPLASIPALIEALAGCLTTARLATQAKVPLLPAQGMEVHADTRGNRVLLEWFLPGGASLPTELGPMAARRLASALLEEAGKLPTPPAANQ